MIEAPPICRNISVTTFIPSWLVFNVTAKIGLLFSNFYIRISLQRNVGNEVTWPNFFEYFAYLPLYVAVTMLATLSYCFCYIRCEFQAIS
jgi:hypothetical protein